MDLYTFRCAEKRYEETQLKTYPKMLYLERGTWPQSSIWPLLGTFCFNNVF